jgi:hypothetical protein
VDNELNQKHIRKQTPTRPETFTDYYNFLSETIQTIAANYSDPRRKQPFSPITGISTGYDSVAASVLAKQVGCTQAFSFTAPGEERSDNSTEIIKVLELDTLVLNRSDYLQRQDMPEAVFCAACSAGTNTAMIALEDVLPGKISFSGHLGDNMWGLSKVDEFPDFFSPDAIVMNNLSQNEFRLQVGYIEISIPNIMYEHVTQIHKISRSPEMKPWSLDVKYNRPIPRRIAEEAGVPRELFGQKKIAGLALNMEEGTLTQVSHDDFLRFYEAAPIPWYFRYNTRLTLRDILTWPLDTLYFQLKKRLKKRQTSKAYQKLSPLLLMLSNRRARDPRRKSIYHYLFHWGFEKTKNRYEF